ncbi:hypothetical protein GGI00_003408 [Coemansia sp. RSA 2681]|nr:hypothetical protein GGI00_003408 [Coemansia sp. RSA 2681]
MRHSESLDDALFRRTGGGGSLLDKFGGLASVRRLRRRHHDHHDNQQHKLSRNRPPLVITRVDHPWPHSSVDLPALDISEIIRRKDESFTPQTPPLSASAPSARTLAFSENRSSMTSATSDSTANSGTLTKVVPPVHVAVHLCLPDNVLRPSTAGSSGSIGRPGYAGRSSLGMRPSTAGDVGGGQRRRLRHDYFRVATMDGQSTVPAEYKCPIAMCDSRFEYFEHLQCHWTEHPWNRGGILTPVCDGGVRRLGWWEHKRKFFASLVHGKHRAEFPENPVGDGTRLRRKSSSIEDVCRSDYGDISLLGSRTYHVSPRVVPMWQVARWETRRDASSKIPLTK